MEEMAAEEEAEARRERMEAALDVTKQKDLSGFYRHIYRYRVGDERMEGGRGQGGSPKRVGEGNIREIKNGNVFPKQF